MRLKARDLQTVIYLSRNIALAVQPFIAALKKSAVCDARGGRGVREKKIISAN